MASRLAIVIVMNPDKSSNIENPKDDDTDCNWNQHVRATIAGPIAVMGDANSEHFGIQRAGKGMCSCVFKMN